MSLLLVLLFSVESSFFLSFIMPSLLILPRMGVGPPPNELAGSEQGYSGGPHASVYFNFDLGASFSLI